MGKEKGPVVQRGQVVISEGLFTVDDKPSGCHASEPDWLKIQLWA